MCCFFLCFLFCLFAFWFFILYTSPVHYTKNKSREFEEYWSLNRKKKQFQKKCWLWGILIELKWDFERHATHQYRYRQPLIESTIDLWLTEKKLILELVWALLRTIKYKVNDFLVYSIFFFFLTFVFYEYNWKLISHTWTNQWFSATIIPILSLFSQQNQPLQPMKIFIIQLLYNYFEFYIYP